MHVSNELPVDGIQPSMTPTVGDLDMGTSGDSLLRKAFPKPNEPATLSGMGANANAKKGKLGGKSKVGKVAPRSVDTPAHRRPVMGDAAIDKKRNKLGYQRISIACAHCRRRKIRCLVAVGDSNAKCQNCVRLKKDCMFYPVDQQTAMEKQQSPSVTKAGVRAASSSAAGTPPNAGSGTLFDDQQGYPTLPSNVSDGYPGVSMDITATTQAMTTPQFAMPQRAASHSPWIGPAGFANNGQNVMASPPQYNHFGHNQQLSGDFTQLPAHLSASPMSTMSTNDQFSAVAHQRADQMWSRPPARAMSNGSLEGFTQPFDPYAGGFHANSLLTSGDRPTAQSMDMHIPTTMMQAAESRATSMPLPMSTFMDQPQLYALQTDAGQPNIMTMSPLSTAYSAQWMPQQSQFVQLQDQSLDVSHDFQIRNQPG